METARDHYFVFSVRNSLYAVDALVVSETFRLPEITPMEETPAHVVGVINLRGRIIPVMDLDILFGREPAGYLLEDAMIVIDVQGRTTGIVVSEVRDVVKIPPERIDPASASTSGDGVRQPVVAAKARVGEEIVMILDHERMLSYGEHARTPAEPGLPGEPLGAWGGLSSPHVYAPEFRAEFHRRSRELMKEGAGGEPAGVSQVAVVTLGGEYFGIELTAVREFSPIANLTPLPNCPEHVIGNMNLRGNILLVIDIRGLLEMPAGRFNRSSTVVVAFVDDITVGVAVEEIHDIASLGRSEISPLPSSLNPAIERFSLGASHYEGKAMTILNMPEILKDQSLVVDEK